MISILRGVVIEKRPPVVVLDVGGVGYELELSMTSFYQLPEDAQTPVKLYVHEVIREDAYLLYGFTTAQERSLFREILKVNQMGAKTSLALLSNLTASDLVRILRNGDVASLCKIPSVGKKTAERLIVELKDRIEKLGIVSQSTSSVAAPVSGAVVTGSASDPRELAVAAMLQLGYNQKQAEGYVAAVFAPEKTVEQLIKEALQMTFTGKKQ